MPSNSRLTSMTVSLPEAQKRYVKEQATATGCSTPSEYIRRLIHADQTAREKERIERKLLEALDTPAREMSKEAWAEVKRSLRRKLESPEAQP